MIIALLLMVISFSKDTSWSKPSLENLTDYKSLMSWERNVVPKLLAITEEILKISAPSGIPSRDFFTFRFSLCSKEIKSFMIFMIILKN